MVLFYALMDRLFGGRFFVHADLLAAKVLGFKANNAVGLCKKGIVLSDADVDAGMEMRAALPYQDIAGQHELTVGTLGP